MKKLVPKVVSALCTVFLCFSMSSCSTYKVEKGYSHFGRVPSMFLGIRTNQIEYPLDNVSLEIAYGWAEGYLDEIGRESYETYSVLIVAYDWTLLGELPYEEPTKNYNAYFSTDNLYILREIKEDFSNEKYVATTSGSWKSKVEYNTKETFLIPEELFENLTSNHSSIYFEIVLIGYSESDNTYDRIYANNITLQFDVTDSSTVKIID